MRSCQGSALKCRSQWGHSVTIGQLKVRVQPHSGPCGTVCLSNTQTESIKSMAIWACWHPQPSLMHVRCEGLRSTINPGTRLPGVAPGSGGWGSPKPQFNIIVWEEREGDVYLEMCWLVLNLECLLSFESDAQKCVDNLGQVVGTPFLNESQLTCSLQSTTQNKPNYPK